MSNYPPGNMHYNEDDEAPQECRNGHKWTAPMFYELGGWFYVDDDKGPVCPVCGCLDKSCDDAEESDSADRT